MRTAIINTLAFICLISLGTGCGEKPATEAKKDASVQPEKKAPKKSPPKIVLENNDMHKWGTVLQGSIVEYAIKFTNEGEEDLIIKNVTSHGGCKVSIANNRIKPGQKGEVLAVFDTTSRIGPSRKNIKIFSNDPFSPETSFAMGGYINMEITLDKQNLKMEEVPLGKGTKLEFGLKSNNPEKIKITSVTSEKENFKVTEKGKDGDWNKYEVEFTGTGKLGHNYSKLTFAIEGGEKPQYSLPAYLKITGNLTMDGNTLFFKKDGKFVSRELVVTSHTGETFEITGAEDDKGLLKIELPEAGGPTATIKISIDKEPDLSKGKIKGLILVKTNSATQPELKAVYTISNAPRNVTKLQLRSPAT